MRAPCQADMTAPMGSAKTAIRPWSPTSKGSAMTVPPASLTRCDRASTSSLPMYTPQAVGASGDLLWTDPGGIVAADPRHAVAPVLRIRD